MKHLLAATSALGLALAANPARAEAPTLVSVTADEADVARAIELLGGITIQTHPAGRLIDAARAASFAKLGLAAGDVVRAIDGVPSVGLSEDAHVAERAAVYLDVIRAQKPLAIRVAVRPPASIAATFDADRDLPAGGLPVIVDAANHRLVIERELGPLRRGDVVTAVDGKPVAGLDTLEAALRAEQAHATKLAIERNDTAIQVALTVTSSTELAAELDKSITKIDDTHYTILATSVDKILANPMAVAKGARVVPAVKNGKPDGFKLYAIRPTSLFAKLGLLNGDTLNTVNGMDLTSADKALEVYTKLRDAKQLVVAITRRGKPLTLTYTIK